MTTSGRAADERACPRCEMRGRSVKPITIRSLVAASALGEGADLNGFYYCDTPACEVAYFQPSTGNLILKGQVRVRIGKKETAPPRTACYCFAHTAEEIEAQVAETGNSTIPDEIAEKCRQGLDRCEETNPRGTCCLASVRKIMKEAQTGSEPIHERASAHAEDCCLPGIRIEAQTRTSAGLWATSGAVLVAALSSACCWLPLLLITFGASAAGVSGFFESYRPYFLAATAILLASGFYIIYFRAARCAPGTACAVPNPKLLRLNKTMLWVATVAVVAFASFPSYVGQLLGGRASAQSGSASGTTEIQVGGRIVTVQVKGMTCAGCARTLEAALRELPGVLAASVDFDAAQATLALLPGADLEGALGAILDQGFEGRIVE